MNQLFEVIRTRMKKVKREIADEAGRRGRMARERGGKEESGGQFSWGVVRKFSAC